jgi:gamma-glutamylcyclotransferase (GGCT)/AIG2-like uncharacterized protein YtfP
MIEPSGSAASLFEMESTQFPLFVYGSLADAYHRAEIIGRPIDAIPATLKDYERGKGRYWFIQPKAGAMTTGAILSDLTGTEFAVLDQYEEVPMLYTRERVRVKLDDDSERECWVYLPTGWEKEKRDQNVNKLLTKDD